MPSLLCPDCLTRSLVVVVCTRGTPCRRCGATPTEPLTRREIVACLRAKGAAS